MDRLALLWSLRGMSMMERVQASRAALSAKELEVLALLAAGHTVKSIAAQLGRSEASVNERLRDARRKTGCGSSRELARLIAAQKNWDENPDLAAGPVLADRPLRPGRSGFARSKGYLIMFSAIAISATAYLLAAGSPPHATRQSASAAAAAAPSPLIGRWSLDVARIPADERPRSVTIEFSESDGRWSTKVEITAPDGSVRHAESTAAPDGVAVPVSGNMGFIDSGSLRQPAPNTLVMSLGKAGAPVSTRVYSVARDGRSMTETIVWASGGIPKLETTYFNRIG